MAKNVSEKIRQIKMVTACVVHVMFQFPGFFVMIFNFRYFSDQRNMEMSMRVERSSLDQVKARFALNKKKMDEKKKEYDLEQRTTELREEEEKLREYRREKKKEKKRKHIEDDHQMGGDQDMMAMMGFGGFGGSKKN